MKLKTGLSLFLAVATLSLTIIGCKKEVAKTTPTATVDTDTSVASDNSSADALFTDAHNITDQAAGGNVSFFPLYSSDGSNLSSEKSTCATVTHDSLSTLRILKINFGTTNCLSADGRYRRGQINVTYSGKYKDSASVHSITFTDYFVNDNQVKGTKTVTNKGHNANGNLTFNISVIGEVIKANNEGTITWNSTRVREMLEGESTKNNSDDVYSITGSSSGVNAKGNTYSAIITTALHRALNCKWFDAGVIEVSQTGKATKTINYGNGTCDSDATVTINGTSYPFTMK